MPLRCFLKRRVKERDLTWKACFTIMLLYVVLILPTFVVRELLIVGHKRIMFESQWDVHGLYIYRE